ncbi:hypothetical protein B566_EDAN016540 [Ephemera danica]|nr:hypothetical protein B566_EDAN016540 [Ephemera danica]
MCRTRCTQFQDANTETKKVDGHNSEDPTGIAEMKKAWTIPLKDKKACSIIKDLNGDEIEGNFYTEELQKVIIDANTKFKIDKILASKGKGLSRQVLDKWSGYPDSFDSWILAKDLS